MDTLRRFFTENLTLKVVAVLLSVLLWVYVRGQEVGTRPYVVRIEAVNKPAYVAEPVEIRRTRSPGSQAGNSRFVTVRVRGPKSSLEDELSDVITIHLDLSVLNLPEGANPVRLIPDYVFVPRVYEDLDVVDIEPEEVIVELEFITWTVKIEPPEVIPPPGMKVINLQVEPESIVVAGPTPGSPSSLTPRQINLGRERELGAFSIEDELQLTSPQLRLVLDQDGARRVSQNILPEVTITGELVPADDSGTVEP